MKDNSTGKDKEFYELGKKMFDRLNPPGTPPVKPYVSKRKWVGLTDEEIHDTPGYQETREMYRFAKAIEALLKEKNT